MPRLYSWQPPCLPAHLPARLPPCAPCAPHLAPVHDTRHPPPHPGFPLSCIACNAPRRAALGWLHRERGVPLDQLSFSQLLPSPGRDGVALVFDYVLWLANTRDISVRTEGIVVRCGEVLSRAWGRGGAGQEAHRARAAGNPAGRQMQRRPVVEAGPAFGASRACRAAICSSGLVAACCTRPHSGASPPPGAAAPTVQVRSACAAAKFLFHSQSQVERAGEGHAGLWQPLPAGQQARAPRAANACIRCSLPARAWAPPLHWLVRPLTALRAPLRPQVQPGRGEKPYSDLEVVKELRGMANLAKKRGNVAPRRSGARGLGVDGQPGDSTRVGGALDACDVLGMNGPPRTAGRDRQGETPHGLPCMPAPLAPMLERHASHRLIRHK